MAKNHRVLRIVVAALLVAVMVWGAVMLARGGEAYSGEKELHRELMALRPPVSGGSAEGGAETQAAFLSQWQALNPDIVGWITIPGTSIDYPFVQTGNNSDYLRRDLNGEDALAGSIFMDARCAADTPGGNTILYGHNMQNDAMFGALQRFAEEDFFSARQTGELFLGGQWHRFTIFACLETDPLDAVVYAADAAKDGAPDAYLEYIAPLARQYQDIEELKDRQLVTLSTCSDVSNRLRIVVVGVIE